MISTKPKEMKKVSVASRGISTIGLSVVKLSVKPKKPRRNDSKIIT